MVTEQVRTLIAVGGPLAGEAYEVRGNPLAIQIPAPLPEGETVDEETYTVELYALSWVVFNGRSFQVLLHPPLRSQNTDAQADAIMRALCKPEAYDSWRSGRRPTNPERMI